jgi:uncharacterized damage-inducible protein DinB
VIEKNMVSSFPTIKDTVFHIWGAEWIWYSRLHGTSPGWPSDMMKEEFKKGIILFCEQSQKFIELIKNTNEKDLDKIIEYKNIEGKSFSNKFYEIIMHCMNHSTFHRGQIITMLREAGVTNLFSTDLITYYRER